MKKSILTKNQKKELSKSIYVDGEKCMLYVTVRYDDHCNNGSNSFSITGSVYNHPTSTLDKYCKCCGTIHDIITKYMPELSYLIKWHGMTSEEPMHYISNTLYYSKDRTHMDKKVGEPVAWDKRLKFNKYPFTFEQPTKGFWSYIDSVENFDDIRIIAVPHVKRSKSDYDYADHYSFEGLELPKNYEWTYAPFRTERGALEMLHALKESPYGYVQTPTKWCESVEANLGAARNVAIWQDATLEQLQDKEQLKARLPKLRKDFRNDIETFGFVY